MADVDGGSPLHLLVWDGPNIDMTLSTLLGAKPGPATRPNFAAVARWLCGRAPARGSIEACVFANVPSDAAERMRPWINAVRTQGFAVFAKPKLAPTDDIDDDMVAHLRARHADGNLAEVVVASHDFVAFEQLLVDLARDGTHVVVLGFSEFAGGALRTPEIDFVDLEDVAGVFSAPLPRVDLVNLPAEGRWFAPTVTLEPTTARQDDVISALSEIVRAEDGPVLLASVGSRLRAAIPGFDHRSMGYDGLQGLVAGVADEAAVELVTVGGHPALVPVDDREQ